MTRAFELRLARSGLPYPSRHVVRPISQLYSREHPIAIPTVHNSKEGEQKVTDEAIGLRNLIAKQAIREALQRYARGVDRGDAPLALSAFHPDAVLRHGFLDEVSPREWITWVMSRPPIDRIGIGHFEPAENVVLGQQHHLTNQTIDIQGETAFSECYFVEHTLSRRGEQLYVTTVGGRYVERYECRDGDWRIAERDAVRDWDGVQPIAARFPGWENSAAGRRDEQDLSYWGGRTGSAS